MGGPRNTLSERRILNRVFALCQGFLVAIAFSLHRKSGNSSSPIWLGRFARTRLLYIIALHGVPPHMQPRFSDHNLKLVSQTHPIPRQIGQSGLVMKERAGPAPKIASIPRAFRLCCQFLADGRLPNSQPLISFCSCDPGACNVCVFGVGSRGGFSAIIVAGRCTPSPADRSTQAAPAPGVETIRFQKRS
jgi:hypothetical protein